MSEAIIHCPQCGSEIPVSQVLEEQIRHEVETKLRKDEQKRIREAVASAQKRANEEAEKRLSRLQEELQVQTRLAQEAREQQQALEQRARELAEREAKFKAELDAKVAERLKAELDRRITAATEEAREAAEAEKRLLQEQLEQQRKRAREAQKAELDLRRQKQELEERTRDIELEIQRKLDAEKARLEKALRESLETEQDLKLKEKEKQIRDLRKALDDARRRSDLGSQELQGETLELDIQARLEHEFPVDRIDPVPKGMRGADIIQTVCNARGEACGTIVWETKNTKAWQPAWLDKLKQDQRTLGAPVAVIVSVALPAEINGFGRIDGVWVSNPRHWSALAVALREQLIQVAWARAAAEGRDEKMAMLYDYLAGDEFRQRVETIVEAFQAMQQQLDKERRAMNRHWAEREKQIQRVIGSTTGMYGALQGIIGSAMPSVPALELEDEPELIEGPVDE